MNATPRRSSANPVGTSFTFERWNECDPAGLPKVHDTTRVHDTTKVHDAAKVHDGAKVHDATKVHNADKVHDRTKVQGSAAPRPLIATTVPAPIPRVVPASTRSIWAEPTRNPRRVPDKRLAAAVSLLVLAVGVAAGALISDRSATKFESAQGVVRTPAVTSPNTASDEADDSETTTTDDSASAVGDAVPTEEPADEARAEAVVSVAPETSNTDPGPTPDTNLDPAAQQIAAAQQNVASTQLPAAVAATHAAAAAAIAQAIAAHASGTSRAGLTPVVPSDQTPGAALESPTVAAPTAEAPPAVAPTVAPAPAGSPDAVPIAPAPAPQDPTAALLAAVFSTAGQVTAPLLNSVCLSLWGCPTG